MPRLRDIHQVLLRSCSGSRGMEPPTERPFTRWFEERLREHVLRKEDNMAEAKICDRCGEFFIEKKHNIDVYYSINIHTATTVGIGFTHMTRRADLCRNCEIELGRWFERKEELNND